MPNTREKHIHTFMHIGEHIRYHEEYELLFDTPLCEAIEYVLAILKNQDANGVTVQEWIPVEDEQKPKDRKHYFIAYVFGDSDMHFFGEAMYHAFEGNDLVDRPHFSNEGVNDMRVTHWMEIPKLPQPPKGE